MEKKPIVNPFYLPYRLVNKFLQNSPLNLCSPSPVRAGCTRDKTSNLHAKPKLQSRTCDLRPAINPAIPSDKSRNQRCRTSVPEGTTCKLGNLSRLLMISFGLTSLFAAPFHAIQFAAPFHAIQFACAHLRSYLPSTVSANQTHGTPLTGSYRSEFFI